MQMAVGLVLDFVLRGVLPRSLRGGYTGSADEIDCHEEHSDEEGKPAPIWKAALRHTLEIFVFIFVFSLVFGLIVEGVGEDVFADALGRMGFFQPVVAALVGLIPNCAASVLLTQLYVEGALRFSSLVAGLCTGAGVGLAVLWRANPSWKQNLFITGLTWAAGAAVGVGIQIASVAAEYIGKYTELAASSTPNQRIPPISSGNQLLHCATNVNPVCWVAVALS